MCGVCGCDEIIPIEQEVLSENNQYAKANQDYFERNKILAINFVSSPGSGKTTFLIKTIEQLKNQIPIAVIEGDQHTEIDADRIRETKVPVIQINTGKMCHLDAHQIGHAVEDLQLKPNSILLIENVGNLICPSLFNLGEKLKVVLLSVTEGDTKPLKYPYIFQNADLMIIHKMDLLPYVDFDIEKAKEYAHRINPNIECIQTSAKTGEGFDAWLNWLKASI